MTVLACCGCWLFLATTPGCSCPPPTVEGFPCRCPRSWSWPGRIALFLGPHRRGARLTRASRARASRVRAACVGRGPAGGGGLGARRARRPRQEPRGTSRRATAV
ncbi:hypothetical protein QJS66_00730 [Kocuria rhizophila]|nr:hypothetical protein QJS66_00730 [Kocuria rhizophila]